MPETKTMTYKVRAALSRGGNRRLNQLCRIQRDIYNELAGAHNVGGANMRPASPLGKPPAESLCSSLTATALVWVTKYRLRMRNWPY